MTAFSDFDGRCKEVEELLDAVAPGWSPERLIDGDDTDLDMDKLQRWSGVLARSSIVLLVSYFEGFLKDLIDEAFDALGEASLNGQALSAHLRGRALMSHVQILRSTDDPQALWKCVEQLMALGQAYGSPQQLNAVLLPREEIKRAVTSIDSHKINEIFKALGDDDLSRGPMSKHGSRLRGLKSVRDNAVHGNELEVPPLSFEDVRLNLDLLRNAAKDMQHRVETLIPQPSSQN